MSITSNVIEVTPELARQWLKNNTANRDIDGNYVERYAGDMRAGNWAFNGETIKIADTRKILDGQHRLMAVVESGVTVRLLVIAGLPEETQETMDQGRPRSLGDVLQLRGEKYYRPLAYTVTVAWRWHKTRDLLASDRPTIAEASAMLERNPDLRDSTAFAFCRRRPWMPGAYLLPLHFLFSAVDEQAAHDFVDGLFTGHTNGAGDPRHVLRERLINAHIDNEEMATREKLALTLKAWAAFHEGRTVEQIRWIQRGPTPEPFPTIAGLDAPDGAVDDLRSAAA